MDKGKIILRYRKLRDISQTELAAKIGINQTAVGKYERGERKKIPILTLYKIIKILEIPVQEILTKEEYNMMKIVALDAAITEAAVKTALDNKNKVITIATSDLTAQQEKLLEDIIDFVRTQPQEKLLQLKGFVSFLRSQNAQ